MFWGKYQLFTPLKARFFGGYKFSMSQLPRLPHSVGLHVATALYP